MDADLDNLVPADASSIARAAEVLGRGGLVAFPTETVYGLGADATNDRAVVGIFECKGRPRFNPLIVHVLNSSQAEELVQFSRLAERLAEAFWPGPLTLVLPRKESCSLSLLVSAGLKTAAVRVPSNAVAQELVAAADRPIAAPSANRSGHVSATTAQHVARDLNGRVDLILDGGTTATGIESTVIGFASGLPVLLRPGAIGKEQIEELAGPLQKASASTISSPGQLASHYAPHASLRLNATAVESDENLLAFGPPLSGGQTMFNLSADSDLKEAAANLFAMLRALDRVGTDRIAVMPIPEDGLGEAINDRLRRAAAPRDRR